MAGSPEKPETETLPVSEDAQQQSTGHAPAPTSTSGAGNQHERTPPSPHPCNQAGHPSAFS